MVVPIYDDNPFKLPHRPVISWGLIGVNVLIFVAEFTGNLEVIVNNFGLIPAALVGRLSYPDQFPPTLTLFSYMFLHSDALHLAGNMLFLWVFGDNVEEALGRARFLTFYLSCGVLAALAFVASDTETDIPLIGASGAIAGVVIAYVMLRPCAKITVLVSIIPLRLSAYWVVGAFAVLQFINLGSASKSEVAYWCHIGGMAAGALLLPLIRPAGVRLFECINFDKAPVAAAMPDTSRVPGNPHRHQS
jgi:membrane associated rhomboid family serine protease